VSLVIGVGLIVVVAGGLFLAVWWQGQAAAVPGDDLAQAADRLVAAWEAQLGAGFGEAKRHQVYAALIKQFPAVEKRSIARAIEDAVGRL